MMNKWIWLIGLGGLIIVLFFFHLILGSVYIPVNKILLVLMGQPIESSAWEYIIKEIRVPRALTAIFSGAALSVAGLIMQTLFRNPLAGPSVLGITAGASLGVGMIMLAASFLPFTLDVWANEQGSWIPLRGNAILFAACLGSGLVLTIVMGLAMIVKDQVSLLILGIMIGYVSIAIVSIWQYFSSPEQLQDFLLWTFGSLGGVSNQQLGIFTAAIIIGLLLSGACTKSLNLLLLGEPYAKSMGLSISGTRIVLIICSSILTGCVTAFCGPITFIGIAGPHLGRMILKTADHKLLLPGTILLGAALLLFCDIVAQWPGKSISLPVNAITALLGAPIVIWVIIRRKSSRYYM